LARSTVPRRGRSSKTSSNSLLPDAVADLLGSLSPGTRRTFTKPQSSKRIRLTIFWPDRSSCRRSLAPGLLRTTSLDAGGFYAAKRFALGCVLAWVLWSLAGSLGGFTNVVVNSSRESSAIIAAQNKKLSP